MRSLKKLMRLPRRAAGLLFAGCSLLPYTAPWVNTMRRALRWRVTTM